VTRIEKGHRVPMALFLSIVLDKKLTGSTGTKGGGGALEEKPPKCGPSGASTKVERPRHLIMTISLKKSQVQDHGEKENYT